MRLEPIAAPSLGRRVLPPALAIAATLGVAALLAMIAGGNPFAVFGLILKGAFGSNFAILETLNSATLRIFTGLAIAVAFRAKLWNIGAEAQLYAGAVITVVPGTGALSLPAPLTPALCSLAATLAPPRLLLAPPPLTTLRRLAAALPTFSFPSPLPLTPSPPPPAPPPPLPPNTRVRQVIFSTPKTCYTSF